jgi:hypothetical protein
MHDEFETNVFIVVQRIGAGLLDDSIGRKCRTTGFLDATRLPALVLESSP